MTVWKRAVAWLLCLAGLAAALAGASWVVLPKDNTEQAGMEQVRANGILAEPPDTIDVLILGDSESYHSISPRLLWEQTGYTSYTCGTDAQRLPYTRTMLERALEKQRPKLVILETLAIYRPIKLDHVVQEELSRVFPVFRYHDRWKSLTWSDLTGPVEATRRDLGKGYAHITSVDPCGNKAYMHPTDQAASIAVINQYYVRAIQALCRRYGARLLLVSTPSPVNWTYERHNGIARFAGQLGCDYLDLNLEQDALQMDWSRDTFDRGDHLNHFGAEKVTRFLAGYLQELSLLTDHRGEAAYAEWDAGQKKTPLM